MAGNAGLFGGLGPNQYIANLYAPLRASLSATQNQRLAAFQQLISDALARTSAAVQNGGAPYANAITDTNNLARQSAAGLAAANPDAQTQSMLRAIGAPQSQQDAVGNQNNTVFNGGASLLGYAGGVIPSTQFSQDAQARTAYLASLPGMVANTARFGINGLANTAAKENLGLDQQQMNATLKARSDLASFVQKNQSLKQAAAKEAFNERFKVGQANERVAEFNAKQTLASQRLNDENFWKGKNYNLQVTKAQWSQANADRNYGLSYSRFKLAEQKAAQAAKTGGVSPSVWHHAALDAENFYKGIAPQYQVDASGQRVLVPGTGPSSVLTYQKAIKTLIRRYPGIGATGAIRLANSLYQPGEGGRPYPQADVTRAAGLVQPSGSPQAIAIKGYAFKQAANYGWSDAANLDALDKLWTRESGWNPNAVNPSSGAAGIPQALGHGHVFNLGDVPAQVNWGLNYIKARYGSPLAAWAHEQLRGWY